VIRTFRSKGLKKFWIEGDRRLLPVENQNRVRRQLLALDAASLPEDLNLPGFRFHGLNTVPKRWSISVSGNYRITFGWDGADAVDVDIEDYH
jgi:proteic killer suppression protein